VKSLDLTPDGRFLATCTLDRHMEGEIHIWSVPDGRDVTFPALRKPARIAGLVLSPDGKSLVIVSSTSDSANHFYSVWRMADGVEITRIEQQERAQDFVFGQGGRYLLFVSSDKVTKLIDLSTGKYRPVFEGMQIHQAVFSRDEHYLGVADDVGMLHVYCMDDINAEIARLPHDESIDGIAFSDDGRFVATASSRPSPYRLVEKSKASSYRDVFDQIDAATEHQLRVWFLRRKELLSVATARIAALPAYAR
jgi:WD40 repeat protein